MRRSVLFYSLALVAFLSVCWVVGFAWFVSQIPDAPSHDTTITDGIVVLTGGERRVELGIERLAEGKGRKLLISGVGKGVTLRDLMSQNPQPQLSRFLGEAPDVTLGREATNTMQNALEAKAWVEQERIQSIRLVTANYHMPRSLYEFRSMMPTLIIIPDPVIPVRAQEGGTVHLDMLRIQLIEYHKLLVMFVTRTLGF